MASAKGKAGSSRQGRPVGALREARRFAQRLSREERMLVVLKRELYEGRWDDMEADLRARMAGRPYVFKLVNRIADDLKRIDRLRAYEQAHGVDLSELVDLT